jgi:hypothetical protein
MNAAKAEVSQPLSNRFIASHILTILVITNTPGKARNLPFHVEYDINMIEQKSIQLTTCVWLDMK